MSNYLSVSLSIEFMNEKSRNEFVELAKTPKRNREGAPEKLLCYSKLIPVPKKYSIGTDSYDRWISLNWGQAPIVDSDNFEENNLIQLKGKTGVVFSFLQKYGPGTEILEHLYWNFPIKKISIYYDNDNFQYHLDENDMPCFMDNCEHEDEDFENGSSVDFIDRSNVAHPIFKTEAVIRNVLSQIVEKSDVECFEKAFIKMIENRCFFWSWAETTYHKQLRQSFSKRLKAIAKKYNLENLSKFADSKIAHKIELIEKLSGDRHLQPYLGDIETRFLGSMDEFKKDKK